MMAYDLSKLGVKRNIPRVNFTEYSGVLEAPEKWGKTTLVSNFENTVICAFEKGYKAQVVDVIDMNKWEDLINFINLLERDRKEIGDDIKTIVFDTVDESFEMVGEYALNKLSRKDGVRYKTLDEPKWGKGWTTQVDYFREQISRIYNLGFSIVFITHSTLKTVTPKDEDSYDIHVSTMPDRLSKVIYPECDYILRGERQSFPTEDGKGEIEKRVLVTKGTQNTTGGSRVHLDVTIPFDTEEQAYAEFYKAFGNKIADTLAKEGITTSLEELSKTQSEEKKAEVETYVNTLEKERVDEDRNEEIKVQVVEKLGNATDEQKDKFKELLSKHQITDISTLTSYPTVILEELLSIF